MSTPWILLRGLIRDSYHWGDFPLALEAAFAGAEVVCLDLPGNGSRWREHSPASVGEAVEVLRAGLRERGIPPPYRLLAISLGGMVALEWLCRYPQEVERACLINSSLGGLCRPWQRLRPANYALLLGLLLLPAALQWRERFIVHASCNQLGPARRRQLALRWAEHARASPLFLGNALRQLWAAARYRAPAAVAGEVLLLSGAGDRLVNPICSRRMAARYGWALRVHPTAGHDLALDDPGWVIGQLQQVLPPSVETAPNGPNSAQNQV